MTVPGIFLRPDTEVRGADRRNRGTQEPPGILERACGGVESTHSTCRRFTVNRLSWFGSPRSKRKGGAKTRPTRPTMPTPDRVRWVILSGPGPTDLAGILERDLLPRSGALCTPAHLERVTLLRLPPATVVGIR